MRSIYLAGVDEAATVRFPQGFSITSAAEQGAVSFGQIEIDDPDGTFDLKNLNPAYIVEDAASPTRLWTGFLYNLSITRGSYKSGPSRVWVADCVDVNNLLTRRVVLSKDGYRPPETDLARLTWLLGNPVLDGLVVSGAFTNTTDNPINLDAADYRWQTPMQILADMTPVAGKVAFAFYNESTDAVELFYDQNDASTYDSTAKISNDIADAGAGVYYPFRDAELARVGENIASRVVLKYINGVIVQENTTTATDYGEMTYVYESSRIGRLVSAQAAATEFLASHAMPEDTITVLIELDAANVNDVLEGQRIQCKFTHLPGLESYTWLRVIRRAVALADTNKYQARLTLSTKVHASIGGGPPPDDFPFDPGGCTSTTDLFGGVTSGDYSNGSNGLWDSSEPVPSGQFFQNPENVAAGTGLTSDLGTFVGGGPATYRSWIECDVGSAKAMVDMAAVIAFATVGATIHIWGSNTPMPATNPTRVYTGGPYPDPDTEGWTEIAGTWSPTGIGSIGMQRVFTPTTAPTAAFRYWIIEWQKTTTGLGGVGGGELSQWTGNACDTDTRPTPGQEVPWTVVTMTGATGTTDFPYAAGSLKVKVDGVLISPASYTETDPTTGDFTLSWAPDTDETVTTSYQAA